MEYSWEALEGQHRRLVELRRRMAAWGGPAAGLGEQAEVFDARFREAVADDLDMPRALVVLNETVSSSLPEDERYTLLASWDRVLGLDLEREAREAWEPTAEMQDLVRERDAARAAKDFARADEMRDRLQSMGLEVMDTSEGTTVRPRR
jgi:cysteinyl-tRNA synthetase